ncbi:MAG: hypothetical protein KA059_09455 [Elusimicrobiales bacterium]|jgi:hypothetical protein|nr:hypothetical protein [Elusimicrobiales bacterium]
MKKIFLVLLMLHSIILLAGNFTREDALQYYKEKSKIKKTIIVSTNNYRDQINPDFKSDKKYTVISLTGKETTSTDLIYVQFFPEVETIHLSGAAKINDKDLKLIFNLPKLEILNLDNTNITGEGFKYLKNLPSLQEIDLTFTRVTDANLQELKKFKTLKNIWLYKSKVTQKGVDMLQKELPGCFISLKPQD